LKEIVPWLGNREFAQGRVCWYTDTATGDFLIDRVPSVDGLFIATGGSGHGFKFLPVIGEKIVDAIEGTLDTELKKIWEWREKDEWGEGDGSRGGPKGMQWEEELEKNHRQH
jgi:sarcosine oxidase/L-pipecolate oxidase